MLTLEQLKKVFIPINVYNKPNNLKDTRGGVQLYNDSVSLYDALQLVTSTPSGGTDLSNTPDSSTVSVFSSTGLDTILPAATTSLAGVMTAQDKININSLATLNGVTLGGTNLGTFSGSLIPDNSTIKGALQTIETTLASIPIITTGSLISASTPITVTNGTNSVIGAGTTLTFIPGNVLLSTLGGSLNLTQINIAGATSGQVLTFNGTNWVATTLVDPIQDHNTLTGKQGGTASEYYHLKQSVYDKLNSATTSTVIGRGASTGEVDLISVTKSLVLIGGELRLNNDVTLPGNDKFYGTDGTGTRGWFDATAFAGVTEVQATDNTNLDFTVTNPTTIPIITADLTDTGSAPGSYGGPATVGTFTVDAKGRLSAAANTAIAITSTAVTDFSEAVDDRVSSLLVAGTGITLTYDDSLNTLTVAAPGAGVSGTGVANRVAYWTSTTNLGNNANFTFDGTNVTMGSAAATSARLTTRGTGGTSATFGIIHQNSTNVDVLKVTDKGSLLIGSLNELDLNPDYFNIATGGTYPISIAGGDLSLYSDLTVLVEGGGSASNTPSFKSLATRSTNIGNCINAQIEGIFGMSAGSNSYYDLYLRTNVNQTGGTSPIKSIYVNPVLTAATNYTGVEINAPGHTALKTVAGDVSFTLGGDAEGDLFYRNAAGNLVRLPVGGPMEVLGSTGTVPAWTTTAGSLPGGSNGDFLIYSGGSWVSGTPIKDKQTGITGTNVTLGATPLSSVLFLLYRNGQLLDETDDYTIVGTTVTMVIALVPTEKITAIYYI